MTEPKPVLLQVSNLKKHFYQRRGLLRRRLDTVHAVDGVSLSIPAGEALGLVGESGCGKTTLARLILRLIEPTSGRIYFDGCDITELRGKALRNYRRNIQFIFQDPYGSLNPLRKVGTTIEEPLRIHGMGDAAARREQVKELLETVGLDQRFASQFPSQLSGGQRQRVGIARALALRPKLVVCDEPVSALDVSIRAQIANLLQDLKAQFGLTYMYISHDLSTVQHLADRVAVMYLGQIVEIAANEAIFRTPYHPYTESLLSATLYADPRRERQRSRIVLQGDPPSPLRLQPGCHFHPRCPIVQEICKVENPLLREVSPGRYAACHFASPSPISAGMSVSYASTPVTQAVADPGSSTRE